MLEQHNVTACLVTRGDVDMKPIIDSLIFDKVIIWDNSLDPDWKVAGRYLAALRARTDLVYWQDDDTIVSPGVQRELLREFDPSADDIVANWGHGDNHAGYDDLPLVCGGAIAYRWAAWDAIIRYGAEWPLNDAFMYECDFVVGALYRNWRHVRLPFEIRDVAYNGERLADEPWQRDLKLELTERARKIRDRDLVAA